MSNKPSPTIAGHYQHRMITSTTSRGDAIHQLQTARKNKLRCGKLRSTTWNGTIYLNGEPSVHVTMNGTVGDLLPWEERHIPSDDASIAVDGVKFRFERRTESIAA